jgi:hypothetical protein
MRPNVAFGALDASNATLGALDATNATLGRMVLRMYGRDDWEQTWRHGSRSIVVWESKDLVRWSEPRQVQVAPETAGNVWAPEAFYDPVRGAYVVFWASTIHPADDPGHTTTSYNRIMSATTRDFRTFSEPKTWFDPGHSVIDSTVIRHDGEYYRFRRTTAAPAAVARPRAAGTSPRRSPLCSPARPTTS